MSRIGNHPIPLPAKVEVTLAPGAITVKGPLGTLTRSYGSELSIEKSGDTLVSISRKFYKSPKRWKAILEANKKSIRDPKDLTVGQALVIP